MLGILADREFTNGSKGVMSCPLLMCIGASNEVPSRSDTHMEALSDRFLLRLPVDYLSQEDNFWAMTGFGPRGAKGDTKLTDTTDPSELCHLDLDVAEQIRDEVRAAITCDS